MCRIMPRRRMAASLSLNSLLSNSHRPGANEQAQEVFKIYTPWSHSRHVHLLLCPIGSMGRQRTSLYRQVEGESEATQLAQRDRRSKAGPLKGNWGSSCTQRTPSTADDKGRPLSSFTQYHTAHTHSRITLENTHGKINECGRGRRGSKNQVLDRTISLQGGTHTYTHTRAHARTHTHTQTCAPTHKVASPGHVQSSHTQ